MKKERQCLIESNFPFDQLSIIAEQESWRKEVNRPASYIHKWWARRLGSVFRGLIIGGFEKPDADFFLKFYNNTNYEGKVVFDPFMGSGTTVHEAIKLGASAIGSDINPVAATMVKVAAEEYCKDDVIKTYQYLEKRCSNAIKHYYKANYMGEKVDVLYYFWVKTIDCDNCKNTIPLMKNWIFSKNAYASKKPGAHSLCPHCGHVNQCLYNDIDIECEVCGERYNPQRGNVHGNDYICPVCGKKEHIVDYMRRKGVIPSERMYAKMIIDSNGEKHYVGIDDDDVRLYEEAKAELIKYDLYIPDETILPGINTNQILNYQYKQWRDMFNSRQLLSFGILSKAIIAIEDAKLRRLFAVLMSGTLEFNNMFCSFKGEGTGAVRPLFYNHILKNELTPLEANPWGCKASSGAFSKLFESRIIRMLDYRDNPFELKVAPNGKTEKVYIKKSEDHTGSVNNGERLSQAKADILCKDSAHTDLADESIDLVVTDPPFFDNVNYSELADFFYVWLKRIVPEAEVLSPTTTRNIAEVQDSLSEKFSGKLADVFVECNRVLKPNGLLIFTYHHSRTEGWIAVYDAIINSGFIITQVIPIKAEMAVSVAIMAAKEPINYDLVFVCRKNTSYAHTDSSETPKEEFKKVMNRIEANSLSFSHGDKMILRYGIALKRLSERGQKNVTKDVIETMVTEMN